ncbi:hypothetical protein CNZ74_14975 [Salmonella enterica]|nr:hypothetical protein [Salmonella enterica]
MNLLDNPKIKALVDYAWGNGFIYNINNISYNIRINYTGGCVFIFQDNSGEPVIIDNDFCLSSQFGNEISEDVFRTIFRKRSCDSEKNVMMGLNYDSLVYNHYKDRVILLHSLYKDARALYSANMLKSALQSFRFVFSESDNLLLSLDLYDRSLHLKVKELIALIEQDIFRCECDMRDNACL